MKYKIYTDKQLRNLQKAKQQKPGVIFLLDTCKSTYSSSYRKRDILEHEKSSFYSANKSEFQCFAELIHKCQTIHYFPTWNK